MNKKIARSGIAAPGTIKIRANRSGTIPGAVTGIVGFWLIFYDEQHWHLIHRLIGADSGWVAFAVVVAFIVLVFRLFRRQPGHVSISKEERE